MNISGKSETGKRPKSTADLAAAARQTEVTATDAATDENAALSRDRAKARDAAETRRRVEARERTEAPGRLATATDTDAETAARMTEQDDPERMMARAARKPADEPLEPLFTRDLAESYRARWSSIQSGFVDDPHRAVRNGDELVAEVITNLADTFSQERHQLETHADESGESSTEHLRVALRRYHSFFERLLTL